LVQIRRDLECAVEDSAADPRRHYGRYLGVDCGGCS